MSNSTTPEPIIANNLEMLNGILEELRGFISEEPCFKELENEYYYWEERINYLANGIVPLEGSTLLYVHYEDDSLELERKNLYSKELEKAIEATKDENRTPLRLGFSELFNAVEFGFYEIPHNTIKAHRASFVLAFLIHEYKVNHDKKDVTSSELLFAVYDLCCNPIYNLPSFILEEAPIPPYEPYRSSTKMPRFVKDFLKPLIDKGDIIWNGEFFVTTHSPKDMWLPKSSHLNIDFYYKWVKKPNGKPYSKKSWRTFLYTNNSTL